MLLKKLMNDKKLLDFSELRTLRMLSLKIKCIVFLSFVNCTYKPVLVLKTIKLIESL